MVHACKQCEHLWQQYAEVAQLRLSLIREQQDGFPADGQPRMALGLRIQLAAQTQISIRNRIAQHKHDLGASAA